MKSLSCVRLLATPWTIDIITDDKISVISKDTGKIVDIEFEFDNHQASTTRISGSFAFGIDHKAHGKVYWAALIKKDKALRMLKIVKQHQNAGKSNYNVFNGFRVSIVQRHKIGKNWVDIFTDKLND